MSLYAEYLRERTKDEIIEGERGFATYRFTDEKTVYLVDLYVRPDFRKSGVARETADLVAEIARKRGCTKMLGSVVPSTKGSTESLKVLLAYGMTLESSGPDFIIFGKEL